MAISDDDINEWIQENGDAYVKMREVAGELVCALMSNDFVETDKTIMATVKLDDDSYRKKPIDRGLELALHDVYKGKRGSLIYRFSVADAQDFVYVEFTAEEVDDVLPMIGEMIKEKTLVGTKKNDLDSIYMSAVRFKSHDMIREELERAAQKAREEEASRTAMQNAPNYGLFG